MKTMYLAYVGITVFGVSFDDADDARQNAVDWWESQGEEDAEKYWDDIEILEIEVPDSATDDDFAGCADVSEYEAVAEEMMAG